MLRIPLPEDDGFALCTARKCAQRKPCKGDQITAGGERSVTPGNQSTRQRVKALKGRQEHSRG